MRNSARPILLKMEEGGWACEKECSWLLVAETIPGWHLTS